MSITIWSLLNDTSIWPLAISFRPKPAWQCCNPSWFVSQRDWIPSKHFGLLHSSIDSRCFKKVIKGPRFLYSVHHAGLILSFNTISRFSCRAPKSLLLALRNRWLHYTLPDQEVDCMAIHFPTPQSHTYQLLIHYVTQQCKFWGQNITIACSAT